MIIKAGKAQNLSKIGAANHEVGVAEAKVGGALNRKPHP